MTHASAHDGSDPATAADGPMSDGPMILPMPAARGTAVRELLESIIAAQADAESTLTRAKAQAEANERISQSLTPLLVRQHQVEKWAGAGLQRVERLSALQKLQHVLARGSRVELSRTE